MRRASAVMATRKQDEGAREFPRLVTMIPVNVEIAQAWQGPVGEKLPGGLLNVSCGGASVRLQKVLPPRTRLSVSVPTESGSRRLLAEVVWTSLTPGRRSSPGVYGIRWVERLSADSLESLLLRMERIPEGDVENGAET